MESLNILFRSYLKGEENHTIVFGHSRVRSAGAKDKDLEELRQTEATNRLTS